MSSIHTTGNGTTVVNVKPYFSDGREWSLLDTVRDLVREGSKGIVLDMSGVPRITSPGVGVVAACVKSIRDEGGDLKLCALSEFVRNVFFISGLDKILEMYPDAEGAARSFG